VTEYENTTPNGKRRKVTIRSVTSEEKLTPKTPEKGRKKRENDCEKIQKETTHSESETEEEDEEKEEATDNIGLGGKVQRRVGPELEEEEGDVTRIGPCEDCCNTRVRLRTDILGECDGKEHTLPETIYNEGFRRMMTLRSSTQHEGDIMGGCGPEPQRKETTPTGSRKHNPLLCCCGCKQNVSQSRHFCAKTQFRIMAFCAAAGGEEGYGSTSICKTCAKAP